MTAPSRGATDNEERPTMEQEILGAVARGWCSPKNSGKVLDTDLAEAIAAEVSKLYFVRSERPAIPEGCTPTDAAVLREANGKLAEENHNLRRCLRWYANGEHIAGFDWWEGPSGDDNWLCPPGADTGLPSIEDARRTFIEKLDENMIENGAVARATLVSGQFKVESPEDEPKVIRGEPEWKIEQMAAPSPDGNEQLSEREQRKIDDAVDGDCA